MNAPTLRQKNRRLATGSAGIALGLVGLAYASVPLYRLFCQVTGFGGTVMVDGGPAPGAAAQPITIRFNANVSPGLPWHFAPAQRSLTLHLGEEGVAFYVARNLADRPVTGVAAYNVTPAIVGRYFHKTACFCFEQQTLAPGQDIDMPLAFWVDPKLATDPATRDIRTITISYSFFRSLEDADRAGALANAGAHVGRATP